MDCIYLGTPEFPPLLSEIANPPERLWARGDRSLLTRTAIAIVGARDATREGREISYQIAADLAQSGIVVVSGLARGDRRGGARRRARRRRHRPSRCSAPASIVVYPAENKELHERIAAQRTAADRVRAGGES